MWSVVLSRKLHVRVGLSYASPRYGMVWEIEFSSHTIPIPYHTETFRFGMGNREISQTPLRYHVLLPKASVFTKIYFGIFGNSQVYYNYYSIIAYLLINYYNDYNN